MEEVWQLHQAAEGRAAEASAGGSCAARSLAHLAQLLLGLRGQQPRHHSVALALQVVPAASQELLGDCLRRWRVEGRLRAAHAAPAERAMPGCAATIAGCAQGGLWLE